MNLIKNYFKKASLGVFLMAVLSSCSWDEGDINPTTDPNDPLIPVASFTASETTIIKGESIAFSDTSTNEPSLYTWNFPGGTPNYSNQANETVMYPGAGVYGVTLTVRNDHGADEILMEDYITVTAPPIIDIDTKAKIRYTFEDNLNSDLDKGLLDITATTGGAQPFSIRPGGGKAFDFNGTNPLVIPGFTGIHGADSRSVALWLNTPAPALAGLVHWGASGSFSRASFKMNKTTGTIRFEYQGGGHNGVTNVADGTWHHIAYTYDGDTIKLYVDGVEDFTISGKVLKTSIEGETEVTIGSQAGGSKFLGKMDDVRIFDVVLTPSEVKVLSEMN